MLEPQGVWNYINAAMPFRAPGSLMADEIYTVTVFLLERNQIIADNDVMNAKSLPEVQMPNANGFTWPDP
jgi:hypothetical protein